MCLMTVSALSDSCASSSPPCCYRNLTLGLPGGKNGQPLLGSCVPKCHLTVIKISKELMKLSPLPFIPQ